MDVRLDVKALMQEMGERARAAAGELAYAPVGAEGRGAPGGGGRDLGRARGAARGQRGGHGGGARGSARRCSTGWS